VGDERRDDAGPSRAEVRDMLRALVNGESTPARASDWATPWVTEEAGDVRDEIVWAALDRLSGSDIETAPGVRLYGPEDFRAWLADAAD
jgi:hypothetical protein